MRWTVFHVLLFLAILVAVRSEDVDRPKRDSPSSGKDCNKSKLTTVSHVPVLTHTITPAVTSPLLARIQACAKAKQQDMAAYNQEYFHTYHDISIPAVHLPPTKPPMLYSYTDDFGREIPFVLEEDMAGEYSVSPLGVPQTIVAIPDPVPLVSTILRPTLPERVIVENKPLYIDPPVETLVTITKDCKNNTKDGKQPMLSYTAPVPTSYSYTQKSKDGSTITTANNGNVIVTATKNSMPPPPPTYILDRFENILHGVYYGVAPVPVQSSPHFVTKPSVSVSPQNHGSYTYTQLNRDGSQTNFVSGETVNKPRPGFLSEKTEDKIVIPVIPPIVPQQVPTPAVMDVPFTPLFYSHPEMDNSNSLPVKSNSGSYSYTQIHKDGSASVHGVSQASKNKLTEIQPSISNMRSQNNNQNSGAYSYIQLNNRGGSDHFISRESAEKPTSEQKENKLVIPIAPPVAPFVLPNPMTVFDDPQHSMYLSQPAFNIAPVVHSGGHSYTQIHKDGSSSIHGGSQFAGWEMAAKQPEQFQYNTQIGGHPGGFSYVQTNTGKAPSSYFPGSAGDKHQSKDKITVHVVPPVEPHVYVNPVAINVLSHPLHFSPEINSRPSQANTGSYSYTQIHKDGSTSVASSVPKDHDSASKTPFNIKERVQENKQSSGGYSYSQINGNVQKIGNKGQVPVLQPIAVKPTSTQLRSGSYSYSQVHDGSNKLVSSVGNAHIAEKDQNIVKTDPLLPTLGSGGFSFSQIHKDGTSSSIVHPAAINSKTGATTQKNTVGGGPARPKVDPVSVKPSIPVPLSYSSLRNDEEKQLVQPIVSRYMYKQLSHSHPDPNAFVVVNIEDKNIKAYPTMDYGNSEKTGPNFHNPTALEESVLPREYVYVPPAFTDMTGSSPPSPVKNSPKWSSSQTFENNPIIVGDVPVQQFSYTQKKDDGSSIQVKSENKHTVLVEQKNNRKPYRNHHRGDIPDSYKE